MRVSLILIASLFRQLLRRRDRSLKPIVGGILSISLSFVPLVLVYHVVDGMIAGILERYLETSSYHYQVFPESENEFEEGGKSQREIEKQLDEIKTRLQKLEGVETLSKELDGFGLIFFDGKSTGVQLRAVEPDLYTRDSGFARYAEIPSGSFSVDEKNLVVGAAIAEELDLSVGDDLSLVTVRTFSNGRTLPRITKMRVAGIFSSGYQELDNLWTFIPYSLGERLFSEEESLSFLGVKVDDPYHRIQAQRRAIEESLNDERWRVYGWDSLNRGQKSNLDSTRTSLFLITFLIVSIAISNIGSSLTMLGLSKRSEIAILKSLGLAPKWITFSYTMIAACMVTISLVIGMGLGTLLTLHINPILHALEWCINVVSTTLFHTEEIRLLNPQYYLTEIPINLKASFFLLVFFLSQILSLLFAYRPAKKLSKIHPLEILRRG